MKESKTFEGRWWIFGKDKPAHFGILHFSPEMGSRLEVKIAQTYEISEIFRGVTRAEFPDVLQGRDKNDKPISLFCSSSPSVTKSGGLASYEFHPLAAIIGQSLESWNAAMYQKVDIHLSLLHNWIGQSRIEQRFTSEPIHQIQVHPKAAIEIKLANAITMTINSDCHTNPVSGRFEIIEGHHISLAFPQPIHAKSILADYAEKLRRLFSILTGTPVALDAVYFEVPNSGENPDNAEFLRKNEAAIRNKRDMRHFEMTAPFKEVSKILPAGLASIWWTGCECMRHGII